MLVTESNFQQAVNHISSQHRVVLDLETMGLDPFRMHFLCGVAIAIPDQSKTYYFPFRHGQGYNLPSNLLEPLFIALSGVQWTTWNGKFDLKFMRKDYARLPTSTWLYMGFSSFENLYPPKVEDVMLAAHLLNENEPNFKLKSVGERYAKYIGYEPGEAAAAQQELYRYLAEKELGGGGNMWKAPSEVVAPYAEQDVILTEKLRKMYVTALRKWELYDLWQELNDYLIVVEKIEEYGLMLDLDRVQLNLNECQDGSQACLSAIRDLTGGIPLNPNSAVAYRGYVNSCLAQIGLPPIPSTEVAIMEDLLDNLPEDSPIYGIVGQGIQFRRWVKTKSAYYEAFLKFQTRNVLHPNLHQIGTVTGRFSSSEPNLQAIPRKEKTFQPKNKVKEVFVARDGRWLVQADYKQAEIYIGAHLAGAAYMVELLKSGHDVHTETAKRMSIDRSIAKRMNFALMYGIGPESLVKDIKDMVGVKITLKQAQSYILEYTKIHPEMRGMYHKLEIEARKNGYIRMITGRLRHYNGREEGHFGKDGTKPSPYQKASSNAVQGSVAEILRLASMQIDKHLFREGVRQLLHVHDSILLEIPEGRYDLLQEIERIMCFDEVAGQKLAVPMRVDLEVGDHWSELRPAKEFIRPFKE